MTKRLATYGLAAVLLNATIYGITKAAGVPFAFVKGGDHGTVALGAIAFMTAVGFAVGALAALAARGRFTRTLQGIAGVLVVLSLLGLPGLDASVATRLCLAVLHVVVGAAYVLALSGRPAPYVGVDASDVRPARTSATESLSAASS